MSDITPSSLSYPELIDRISDCLTQGKVQAARQVNSVLLETYWQIGRYIIKSEQSGQEKAEYGSNLLKRLSTDLKASHGKGFSRRNVLDMRRFYLSYPKWQTVSAKLSWSHYTELLAISDELGRSFYEQQCIRESWSVRELKRQKDTALFERVALSKNREEILTLSKDGLRLESVQDVVRDPYVFEVRHGTWTAFLTQSGGYVEGGT
jgi:DUF1016 N-terminal domain